MTEKPAPIYLSSIDREALDIERFIAHFYSVLTHQPVATSTTALLMAVARLHATVAIPQGESKKDARQLFMEAAEDIFDVTWDMVEKAAKR